MSFIDTDQRRTTILDDTTQAVQYRVQTNVTRGVGIDPNLFVFSTKDGTFQYVASLYDLLKWPSDRAAAKAQILDFYRQPSVDVTYPDGVTAQEAADDHLRRLQLVVRDWDNRPNNFPGETVTTIQGNV